MTMARPTSNSANPALLAGLITVYFIAGKLALKLAFLNASATPVWPCTGIALAALLLFGYRAWPAVFFGAFFVNLTTAGTIATSFGIATGNTLEALFAYGLVTRFASGLDTFRRTQTIFKFVLLGCFLSAVAGASIGTFSLLLGGLVDLSHFPSLWLTWWLGDSVGALFVTPLILVWVENPRINWNRTQIAELACLFFGLVAIAWFVFGNGFSTLVKNYPLEYLCFPFLIWAALRFGRRKAATAICVLAILATWGTVHGYGPFARTSQDTSLLLLQSFMAIVATTTMVLAAETSEHKRAEENIRRLADSDPLTGLANYRRLTEFLDAEIKRFGRSQKPFAVLLLDLDHLKQINDTYGHLVGSRALCRLADVLRMNSREIDLAARYGGDEFVLVLPETEAASAAHVAQRISTRLTGDVEIPALTVSTGVAVHPADGLTLDELFAAADRALYLDKSLPKANSHQAQ